MAHLQKSRSCFICGANCGTAHTPPDLLSGTQCESVEEDLISYLMLRQVFEVPKETLERYLVVGPDEPMRSWVKFCQSCITCYVSECVTLHRQLVRVRKKFENVKRRTVQLAQKTAFSKNLKEVSTSQEARNFVKTHIYGFTVDSSQESREGDNLATEMLGKDNRKEVNLMMNTVVKQEEADSSESEENRLEVNLTTGSVVKQGENNLSDSDEMAGAVVEDEDSQDESSNSVFGGDDDDYNVNDDSMSEEEFRDSEDEGAGKTGKKNIRISRERASKVKAVTQKRPDDNSSNTSLNGDEEGRKDAREKNDEEQSVGEGEKERGSDVNPRKLPHGIIETRRHLGFFCLCNPRKAFKNQGRLTNHIKHFNWDPKFQCPSCPYRGVRLTELRRHLRESHKLNLLGGSFGCSDCGAIFNDREAHKTHRQHFHVRRGEAHFQKHARDDRCKDPLVFRCQCGRKFSKKRYLTSHIQSFTNPATFGCDHCSGKFHLLNNLHQHLRKVHHLKIQGNKRGCGTCGQTFDTTRLLQQHKKDVHGIPVWGKVEDGSKKHGIATATAGSKFQCLCGLGFSRRRSLVVHINSKGPRVPFKCTQCGVEFRQHTRLKMHMRKMHNLSECEGVGCIKCGCIFPSRVELRRHQDTIHNRGKPKKSET